MPLSRDGEALRVLVCSPLEIDELEDLADLLDRPLQPLITPEYRWHLAFAVAVRTRSARAVHDARRAHDTEQRPIAVGRARSVIVDGTAPPFGGAADGTGTQPFAVQTPGPPQIRPIAPVVSPITVAEPTIKMIAPTVDEPARQRQDNLIGIVPSRVDTAPGLIAPRGPAGATAASRKPRRRS